MPITMKTSASTIEQETKNIGKYVENSQSIGLNLQKGNGIQLFFSYDINTRKGALNNARFVLQSLSTIPGASTQSVQSIMKDGDTANVGPYALKMQPIVGTDTPLSLEIYGQDHNLITTMNSPGGVCDFSTTLPSGDRIVALVKDRGSDSATVVLSYVPKTSHFSDLQIFHAGQSVDVGEYSIKLDDLTIPYGEVPSQAVISATKNDSVLAQDVVGPKSMHSSPLSNGDVINYMVGDMTLNFLTSKWAQTSYSVDPATNVLTTTQMIKDAVARIQQKDMVVGLAKLSDGGSVGLAAVLRKQTEEASGIENLSKSGTKALVRLQAGYEFAKDIAANVTADKERQEVVFEGKKGKNKMGLSFTRSDVHGEWSKWVNQNSTIHIDRSILIGKAGALKDVSLGLVYKGYNNTLEIFDAKGRIIDDFVGPSVNVLLSSKEAASVRASLGALVDTSSAKSTNFVLSADAKLSKDMRIKLAAETAKAAKQASFTIDYKF